MRKGKPTLPNKTGRPTAADAVMTPPYLAKKIIAHYNPIGKCLEPCSGENAFYDLLPEPKDWCEISYGRDFLSYRGTVDWIITNPPYSIYNSFLIKCFLVADNVVLLVPLAKAFKSISVEKIVRRYGGLKEIWLLGTGSSCGFGFGFPVGCLYYKRNYRGPIDYLYGGPDLKLTRKEG